MDFTKEAAENAEQAVDQMFKALPKKKQGEFLGHLNEVCLFIEAAKKEAPAEDEAETIDEAEARGN